MSLLQKCFLQHKLILIKSFYILLTALLLASIVKDVSHLTPFAGDLRNRIVGARMIKDGLSPYFYIWKKGDSNKYYLPPYPQEIKVSSATATPFFHSIFSLVADLPEFQIIAMWLFLQYLVLAGCFLFAISCVADVKQRKMVTPIIAFIAVTFTYTFGWRAHVYWGQNYIFIPLLALIIFYLLKRRFSVINALLFAVFATSLVLLRPIAILIFLPLVFNPKEYFKWGCAFFLALLAYLTFVLNSPVQKNNWNEYFQSVKIHMEDHQIFGNNFFKTTRESLPNEENPTVEEMNANTKYLPLFEVSGLSVFYDKITSKKLSVNETEFIGLAVCVVLLFPLLLCIQKKIDIPLLPLLLLGFCVYDVFTFCQPIIRGLYNWVEFIFPLLLLPIYLKKIHLIPLLVLIIGFIFNVFLFRFIKMRHILGEAMILLSLLYFIYRPLITTYFREQNWKLTINIFWL